MEPVLDGLIDSGLGQLNDPRKRHIAKSERTGSPHGARHIRHAVMKNVVDDVGRIAMVVGRLVSMQPPWSMATSMMTPRLHESHSLHA